MDNKATMFQHRLPNGNIIMHEGLPRELAIKRMEDHERWCQEHREESVSYTHLRAHET